MMGKFIIIFWHNCLLKLCICYCLNIFTCKSLLVILTFLLVKVDYLLNCRCFRARARWLNLVDFCRIKMIGPAQSNRSLKYRRYMAMAYLHRERKLIYQVIFIKQEIFDLQFLNHLSLKYNKIIKCAISRY